MTESTETQPEGATTRDEAVRAAHSKATSDLRVKYRTEFNEMVKANAAAAGFDWSPKKTAEEKRRAEFEALLAEDPSLAKIVTG